MGEDENLEVEESQEGASTEPAAGGFSIGKVIEWLLANMIPVIVAVVLSAIVSIIIVRANMSGKSDEIIETKTMYEKEEPFATFELGEFKNNTADTDDQHFVRISITAAFEEKNKPLAEELVARKSQIVDLILTILSSKTKAEMDEGNEKEQIKDEILKKINEVMKNGEIRALYFSEFVIS